MTLSDVESREAFSEQMLVLLHHPGSPKMDSVNMVLQICVGMPKVEDVAALRRQLADACFLLWLVPPKWADEVSALRAAVCGGHVRTLVGVLDDAWAYEEKVYLAAMLLKDRRISLLSDPQLRQCCAQEIEKIDKSIKLAVENMNQNFGRGLIRLRSAMHNLPALLADERWRLGRLESGTDVVVCGAGPSLAGQLQQVKARQKGFVLLAVGHALPTLLQVGIEPDLVISDDSRVWWAFPEALKPACPLAACVEVQPALRKRFSRVIWFAGNSPIFNDWMHEMGVPLNEATLHKTVSIHAMDIALQLGAARIGLIGQDLSIMHTGQSHAEGAMVSDDEHLVRIAGTDGGDVTATHDLLALRDAMEEFVQRYQAGAGDAAVPICNCTPGGACIAGTKPMTLENFCREEDPLMPRPELLKPLDASQVDVQFPVRIRNVLREHADCCEEVVAACRALQRELERYPVKMERVQKLQRDVQQAVNKENSALHVPAMQQVLSMVMEYVDELLEFEKHSDQAADNPGVQLQVMRERYAVAQDLLRDLAADLHGVCGEEPVAGSAVKSLPGPWQFSAFRSFALRYVRKGNQELAEALMDRTRWPLADRFSIRLLNQNLQYVEVIPEGGHRPRACSSLFSMQEETDAAIAQHLQQYGTDVQQHVLVLVAPGNWAYPVAWGKKFPALRMVVVEPWVDLFSTLIEHGCFLQQLPSSTVVIGVDESLKKWQKVLQRTVKDWKRQGMSTQLFVPPRLVEFPEVAALVDVVKRVL